jgi:hypothetical protein
LNGLGGPINVAGEQYQLEMPSLNTLTDTEIAGVLTYIRREWEHGADPIRVEKVKQLREQTKDRTQGWTAKELLELR